MKEKIATFFMALWLFMAIASLIGFTWALLLFAVLRLLVMFIDPDTGRWHWSGGSRDD